MALQSDEKRVIWPWRWRENVIDIKVGCDLICLPFRDSEEKSIYTLIQETVVGDMPCDGIFISGHNVKCDEVLQYGESDIICCCRSRRCAPPTNSSWCPGFDFCNDADGIQETACSYQVCEAMANATVICTDKTGVLTQISMTVVAGPVGIHAKFVCEKSPWTNAVETAKLNASTLMISRLTRPNSMTFFLLRCRALQWTIAGNSTAFENDDPNTGKRVLFGSKTEIALLQGNRRSAKETCDIPDAGRSPVRQWPGSNEDLTFSRRAKRRNLPPSRQVSHHLP